MASASTIVLVTGANSGVGYAITQVVSSASKKYHVIMACRNREYGKKALADIQATEGVQGTISLLQLDMNDPESLSAAAKEVEEKHGRVDVLVNNAAISPAIDDTSLEAFEKTMKTNVIGPAMVTKAFEHLLVKSSNAYSIYISSIMGSFGAAADKDQYAYNPGWTVYRQSKAALNMWVLEESKILSKKGVKTFAMCPGYVVSNLRGTSEEQRSGGGYAGDPLVSGHTFLSIMEGKRDADVGRMVHKDGVYTW